MHSRPGGEHTGGIPTQTPPAPSPSPQPHPHSPSVYVSGVQVRQAKLLFYARLAEQGLQTYERDGWGDYPTDIIPERREIRPTADRGPILLCVDTSGSMRGPRETVAKVGLMGYASCATPDRLGPQPAPVGVPTAGQGEAPGACRAA